MHGLNRRGVLAGLGLIVPAAGLAQTPTRSAVHFEVWRNNQKIGEHSVSFRGDDAVLTAAIVAEMLVKLGPIPLFRYRHEATEVWRGGRFATLDSYSISNGKVERVSAVRTDEAVTITTGPGRSVRGSARLSIDPLEPYGAGRAAVQSADRSPGARDSFAGRGEPAVARRPDRQRHLL
jgi:hypothetical protein